MTEKDETEKVAPQITVVSMDDFTYGELEIVEDICGVIPTGKPEDGQVKMMLALGYVAGLRTNPDLTLEEVRAMPVGSIVFETVDDETGKEGA